jgi:hypothetical protein
MQLKAAPVIENAVKLLTAKGVTKKQYELVLAKRRKAKLAAEKNIIEQNQGDV